MDGKVDAEINRIAAANGGKITPEMVLKEAQNKNNDALHGYFEQRGYFDPKKAQHQYGLFIARELIRSVKIRVTTETFSIVAPAYVRSPDAAPKTQGYSSIARLRTEEDLARAAIVAEFSRAGAALARAQDIAAALGLSDEIADLRSRVDMFRNRVAAEENAAAH